MKTSPTCDFLVIGGGIIGVSVARELRGANPGASVVILEKEARLGLHARGLIVVRRMGI
jgi:L-2-hydroxyglutarate oxidase LhgO